MPLVELVNLVLRIVDKLIGKSRAEQERILRHELLAAGYEALADEAMDAALRAASKLPKL